MAAITRILTTPEWFIYIISLILEVVSIYLIYTVADSICIVAYEMSTPVNYFLYTNCVAILPDLNYAILIIFFSGLARDAMAVIYNLLVGVLGLASGIVLLLLLTYCGNPAQNTMFIAAILGIVAGGLHLISAIITHFLKPSEETYLWSNEDEE